MISAWKKTKAFPTNKMLEAGSFQGEDLKLRVVLFPCSNFLYILEV